MNFKEWVILLIPIVLNGIILFVFQEVISKKIDKVIAKSNYKQKIWVELSDCLNKLYICLRKFQYIDSSVSGKNYEFSELFNPISEAIQELKVFVDTHPILTKKVNYLDPLFNEWDGMVYFLREYQKTGNSVLNNKETMICSSYYMQINDLVQQSLQECEKLILK